MKLKTISTAGGGSITIIDLLEQEKVASIDVLKNQGFKPNCIIMLPKWHHDDAH